MNSERSLSVGLLMGKCHSGVRVVFILKGRVWDKWKIEWRLILAKGHSDRGGI